MSRSLLLPKLLKMKLSPPTRLHLTKALLPACACALLSLPLVARAGQWSFSLTGTGTTTDTQGNPAETFPFTDSVPLIPFSPPNGVDVSGGTDGAHCSLICYYGGAVSLDTTATLTWVPSYPGDTSAPPPTVDVLETSDAEAGQTLIDPTGVNIFAADGLGDTEVDQVTLIGPMGGSGHTGYDYDTSSSGKHLLHLTVPAGQTTVTVPLRSLSTNLSFASSYGGSSPALYCAYVIQQDSRAVTLSRDRAHNETADPDGTVHGDTTYAYLSGNVTIGNTQWFHPNFGGTWSPNPEYISNGTGPLFNIDWKWNPSGQPPAFTDTWNSHGQNIDTGTVRSAGTPDAAGNHQWVGRPDTVKHISVSYTATDLNPNTSAKATATYDLRVHDQYDNWRRVDTSGNPVSGSVAGESGSLTQIGQNTAVRQDVPLVSLTEAGIDWNAVGIVGGGTLSSSSVLIAALGETALDPPTWPVAILGILGFTVSMVSSLPPPQPAPPVGPPDQINSGFLQTAYQNYIYDQTAYPGEENNSNLVDTSFAGVLANNPDFQGYDKGNYGTVSITATVYQQMLNYYFYADEYDTGGLAATNVPSTIHRPGGHVWRYLWTYAGGPVTPSNPS